MCHVRPAPAGRDTELGYPADLDIFWKRQACRPVRACWKSCPSCIRSCVLHPWDVDLFPPSDFDYNVLRRQLAAAAEAGVYLGTSSWKYPGWLGTVYDEQRYLGRGGKISVSLLEQTCLQEYAMLFPTVCVDAAYYRFPVVDDLLAMAEQVPEDFRFTFKVTDEITIKHFPTLPKYGARGGSENPHFLDLELFNSAFLRPCQSIAGKVGMLIFEFSPFDSYDMSQWPRLMTALDRFLGGLPTGWHYGVEIRNHGVLTPDYFAMLGSHGISHVYNAWSAMPALEEQLAMPGSLTNPECVGARLLLKPGRKYDEAVKAFSPYEVTQEELPAVRRAAAHLVRQRLLSLPNRRTFIYVNNRLEGNAPRTIAAVLAMAEAAG